MLSTVFLLQLFQSSHADVFVYPTILQERTTTKNLVLRLNSNLTLNLERSSVLADELVVVTSSHGGDQLEKVDTSAIQEVLYQDKHHQSSLMVHHREGSVHVEGIINHELRIKPLPEDERSLQGRTLHKIYKVQEIEGAYANIEPALTNVFERSNVRHQGKARGKNNRKPPQSTSHGEPQPIPNAEKFTVELHVISDSVHQKSFTKNEELIAYLAIMTNGVNLRYLDMKNPRISFILVGVTRSKDDPFANHMKGFLYGPKTLDGLKAYKNQGKIPGKPDVVHLLTGQDLVTLKDGNVDHTMKGLAFVGAVCSSQDVGESEDTAMSYDGTMVMAHELGHVLGSPHDDGWSKDPECAWGHGYLMSYVDGGVKKYRLSKCSEDKIRTTFKKLKQECLDVKAQHNYQKDHRKFPGQTMREAHYCRKILKKEDHQKVSVKKPPHLSKTCHMECCTSDMGFQPCRKTNIPDGMACSNGKTCRRGVCGVHTWEQFK